MIEIFIPSLSRAAVSGVAPVPHEHEEGQQEGRQPGPGPGRRPAEVVAVVAPVEPDQQHVM